MNIFKWELEANFRSLITWSVIVLLFVTIGFGKFSAYEGNYELVRILDGLPPALMEAFNFQAFNLTTITGFFGVMFAYFALTLSLAAVMWGSDIINKEERDRTVEFSLTLPVPRSKVVAAKAAAALVNCVALLLVTWGLCLINATSYEPDSTFYSFVRLSMLALFIVQLVFLTLGLFLGCAMKQHRQVSSAAVSLLLGTYFLSIISGLHEDLDFLKYVSPFKYFDPALLLRESRMEAGFVALSAGIIVACLIGAFFTYSRRDLYI